MNNITVYGRLGRDPEIKDVNGSKVMELNVCQCQKKSEEGQTPVWWHVSFWGDRFSKIEQYLKKGSAVVVIGEMSPPYTYQSKAAGWTTSLKIKGADLRFNPFGGESLVKKSTEEEKDVTYPHEFQSKGAQSADLGDLF